MKIFTWVVVLMVLASCQKEEFKVTESQDEQNLTQDDQLLNLVKTVATHDGSFDDIVDSSTCFSINFPYICNANGVAYPVNAPEDLLPFSIYDELIPDFPVTITLANYVDLEIPSYEVLQNVIEQCANGELFNERITCVDLIYPVTVSVYDTVNTNFETRTYNHDRDTFTGIELFGDDHIANLIYPIQIQFENGAILNVESNEQLKNEILGYLVICED